MNEFIIVGILLFVFLVIVVLLNKLYEFFLFRLAKSWNDMKKANKINKKIERMIKK